MTSHAMVGQCAKKAIRKRGYFAENYGTELLALRRIGSLDNHLNINAALRRGRLADVVLSELRRKM